MSLYKSTINYFTGKPQLVSKHHPVITSLPANPDDGQAVILELTGRKVLMVYKDSVWGAEHSYGTMVMYVDGGSGSDVIEKGTGSGSDAFATVQYAIDQIPGMYNGNVTIHVAAGIYSAGYSIQGKQATGDYEITIQGTMSTLVASQAITSSANTTLTKTGAGWTIDAYVGKLCRCTKAGEVDFNIPIKSNTATVLTFAGREDSVSLDNSWNFEILDWTTYFDGPNTSGNYSFIASCPNIRLYQIDFSPLHASGRGTSTEAFSSLTLDSCYCNGGLYSVLSKALSDLVIRGSYIRETGAAGYAMYINGNGDVRYSEVAGSGKTTGFAIAGPGVFIIRGSLVRDGQKGLGVEGGRSICNSGGERNYIENCTIGISTILNGVSINATVQYYTGCTTDYSAATGGQQS